MIKSNMILLIFCAVCLLEIAEFSDENIGKTSNLLIRKKRIIDKTRSGDMPAIHLIRSPYIVNILKNEISHCAGTILDSNIILTNGRCRPETFFKSNYTILSGSVKRDDGISHNITSSILHPESDLELLKISPPINIIQGFNKKIDLYAGELPPFVYGTFSGWGCIKIGRWKRLIFPKELMITRLPIISLQECIDIYNNRITDRRICTLDISKRRGTCNGDDGGPLVYDDRLLGILLFRGLNIGVNPDIFVNLNHPELSQWVIGNMHVLRA